MNESARNVAIMLISINLLLLSVEFDSTDDIRSK